MDGFVSQSAFAKAVRPTVCALDHVCGAARGVGARFGHLPAASSLAVAELAGERRFCHRGWAEPVGDAHSAAGLLVSAAVDHLQGYANLVRSPPTTVYAHLVLARAGFEASAQGLWLSDRRISVDTRVKRAMLYQLADGMQRSRVPVPLMRAKGRAIIDRVREGAPAGWQVICNTKQRRVDGEMEPSMSTLIDDAIARGTGNPAPGVGALLWSSLSGAVHSAGYALAAGLHPMPDPGLGPLLGGLSIQSDHVALMAAAVCRAAVAACEERFGLMGWGSDEEWREAVGIAEDFIAGIVSHIPAAKGPR